MSISLSPVATSDLGHLTNLLCAWQTEGGPVHLHPGDLGWFSLRGAEQTAAALRVWTREGVPVALGLLDGPEVLRLGVDPAVGEDRAVAERIAADVAPGSDRVFNEAAGAIEARRAGALVATLRANGWETDELWTPFRLDLGPSVLDGPVDRTGVRIERVGRRSAEDWCAVHRSAFRGSDPSDEERTALAARWQAMMSGPVGHLGHSIAARDASGAVVAIAAVWSAGRGRPGLIEPMGVHANHRGRGLGVAITRAAAAALRAMGSSSATVCTQTDRTGAVATYAAAGFEADAPVPDLRRPRC